MRKMFWCLVNDNHGAIALIYLAFCSMAGTYTHRQYAQQSERACAGAKEITCIYVVSPRYNLSPYNMQSPDSTRKNEKPPKRTIYARVRFLPDVTVQSHAVQEKMKLHAEEIMGVTLSV